MHYLAERTNGVNGGLLDFPRSVDELFKNFWGMRPSHAEAWMPDIDVVETPQAYIVRAEIPGIDPKDVDVTLTGDTLTIRGEKPAAAKLEDETWCLSERRAGSFERKFSLPTAVSPDNIEAEARQGVLTIKVAKAQEAQPHRIDIHTR